MLPELDRGRIERALRRAPGLHLYAIGDLDDFFFPLTSFFASEHDGELDEVAVLYRGSAPPTLLALTANDPARMVQLVEDLGEDLPETIYAHLTPGLGELLAARYRVESKGMHLKMTWTDRARTAPFATGSIDVLRPADEPELRDFYAASYPDNWFVPRMLETEHYVGLRLEGALAVVAGVHVVSRRYRVAALGNVATSPALRGRGLARRACAHLCHRLAPDCDLVGLNVEEENRAAVRCYQALGFEVVGRYEEALLQLRGR